MAKLGDDNLIVGPSQVMKDKGEKLAKEIEIEGIVELKEFVACKIKIDNSQQQQNLPNMYDFWTNLVQKNRSK